MTIEDKTVVDIDYTLRGDDGTIIDSSEGQAPFSYLHGASNIVPGLERELSGRNAGDSLKVSITPADAYGEYREENVIEVPREQFPPDQPIEPGMRFHAQTDQGPVAFLVKEVAESSVRLDGNHPLAGQTLHFDVTIRGIRPATEDEVAHGHVHQKSGCCGGDCGCH